MKITIGVATHCNWTSYGSILQTFALQKILKDLNINSFVFTNMKTPSPKKAKLNFKNGIKPVVKYILDRPKIKQTYEIYQKNTKFIQKNISLTEYDNYLDLLSNPPQADYYLSGSDQVINPINPDATFFFDFVDDPQKRLTYACSMGNINVPKQNEEIFKKLINNFDLISVREEDNIDILKQYNSSAIYLRHVDPTFLLNKNEWSKFEKKYEPVNGKYILTYALFWDTSYNAELKKLHKQTGLKILSISKGFNRVYANKKLYDVGVEEFLWLVRNAEYVITSSFHGVAFSIIFEKQFSVVIDPKIPSRINSILELLNIQTKPIADLHQSDINYEEVSTKIKKEKERSLTYLKQIIDYEK